MERSKASDLFVEKHEVYSSCAPAAPQTQDKVQRGLLLNAVVGERAAIFKLSKVACEYEALLVRGDAFFVMDLALHHVDCVPRTRPRE